MIKIPSNATTTALAAAILVKTSSGTLHSITGYSDSTSTQFIQVHDSTSLPADGTVPVVVFSVPAKSNFSFDLGEEGRYFTNGIVLCNSSTVAIKTIGSANCWFDVQYK